MNNNKEQSGIREGDPIFVESLLSYSEWRAGMKAFPNTSHLDKPRTIYDFKPGNMKWRHQMGESIAPGEAHTINLQILRLKERNKVLPAYDPVRCGDGHYPNIAFHP